MVRGEEAIQGEGKTQEDVVLVLALTGKMTDTAVTEEMTNLEEEETTGLQEEEEMTNSEVTDLEGEMTDLAVEEEMTDSEMTEEMVTEMRGRPSCQDAKSRFHTREMPGVQPLYRTCFVLVSKATNRPACEFQKKSFYFHFFRKFSSTD